MASRPARDGGRVPLAGSFAFRLGAAFAVVAVAAAGITALVVNAALTARFDRYLHQQQRAQVTRITMAAGRAYAGNGKWDLHALQTLVPAVGSGTLRVVTPSGKNVWQWDGHRMSWNGQWMQHGTASHRHHATTHSSTGHGGCGSWDNCGSWNNGSWNNGSWDSGSWNSGGWTSRVSGPAVGQACHALGSGGPITGPGG